MCPNYAQKIKPDLFTEIERPLAQIPALKLAQTEQIQTDSPDYEAKPEFNSHHTSDYLQDVRETARKQLSREIRDELGQLISLLKIDLYRIEKHEKKTLSKRWPGLAHQGKTLNLNKPIKGF